ncbi:MAG: MarR family winged helix-turn-helix transcriptional regulator [Vulcanimicrobiaceae bacterium]
MGNARMSEFARTMACDAGNLSGTIDRLEEAGLALRAPSTSDRRVRMVRATAEGRRVAAKLARKLEAARVIAALRQLDEHERRALRATLERLCAAARS